MTDIAQEFAMSMYASSADRNAAMLAEIERLRAEVAGLLQELAVAQGVMRSARVFVTSREKIKHPEGTEWFDSAVAAIDAALAARKREA